MKRFLTRLLPLLLIAMPSAASAQSSALGRARSVAGAGGISTGTSLPVLIGNIINSALALLGVVLVVLIIYAGFLYLTAGGDEKKVSTAKAVVKNAIIGMVLTMSAYAITAFVVGEMTRERDTLIDGIIENPGG